MGRSFPFDMKNDFMNSLLQLIADPWVKIVEKGKKKFEIKDKI